MSLPVRGAWIEIKPLVDFILRNVSLPVRGAWIEITKPSRTRRKPSSLPVRGAWIEISPIHARYRVTIVAPRAGSVD